MSDLGAVRA